ncbi:MAG TPA: discoidin domain-containing protein, partial [Kribbellaceae bacterium]|nr:discoidin domain-containing protein [Kribbellaceae bacterium]
MRSNRRSRTLLAAALAAGLVVSAGPTPRASAAGGPNLAAGKPASASTTNGPYVASNLTDGNAATYWESASGAFPQWAQVDLGDATAIDQVVLKLPPSWGARTQTLSLQASTDGTGFSTIAGSTGYVFDPANANTVTINFGATTTRFVRANITANTGWHAGQLAELEVFGAGTASVNLARGKAMAASSSVAPYVPGNANDGDRSTYWESANNALPQWVQVDLGAGVGVNRLVLRLPSGWGPRTQTLSVQGSTDGTAFATVVASAGYAFDPGSGNAVTITFGTTTTRYVRLTVTANTGWPAGQLAELEVYGPATGDTQPPTAPTNLAYTQPAAGQIRLTWGASSDNVGVTGYDVYANGALRASVNGSTLTYTDTQPDTATVTYTVRARDAAGNQSAESNLVTRPGSGGGGSNLAVGKPISASSTVHIFEAVNANDDNITTYWEGAPGAYPSTLTVRLGANAVITSIVLKLNPDPIWGPRTQTLEILGREQSASAFTTIKASAAYGFNPSTGNLVTIPVSATTADVQLRFTANTGSSNGQVAELQVFGTPAPNPDLTVTGVAWTPASPVETDAVTLSATVRNAGTAASGATDVNFYLGTTKVGTAAVGGLAAGASTTVSAGIGTRDAGTYAVTAKVDENNTVIELNEANNAFTAATSLVVAPVASSDLVAASVGWSPDNPPGGATVTFTVAIRNQGTVASAGGAHGITLTVRDDAGSTVRTLTGSFTGTIGVGVTTAPVTLGTWTAANGRYTVRVVIAVDANELPVKQANNTSDRPLFVGRGANMPYDMYEAEDGTIGGGAAVVGPNRTVGDLAGEASGRRAVTLNNTGAFVELTTKAATNTLVTRFSIPDAPGGGGINETLD